MGARHFESLARFLRTIRHLRVGQIRSRMWRFARPRPDPSPAPPLRTPVASVATSFVERPVSYLGDGRYEFLNQIRRVEDQEFAARKGELLWDYNFHYFDGLLGKEPSHGEKWRWIMKWIASVPPGSRPAWDPYPTSRRIANWIRWMIVDATEVPDGFLDSLASQTRYLERTLEYHLLANHLLTNAVSLTMAGAFFGGAEGDTWLQGGARLLNEQLREQFLSDGAHYELSPVYHAVILEDLLDLAVVARRTDATLPDQFGKSVAAACRWLLWMTRPDGRVPLFNDASYGVAASTERLREHWNSVGVRDVTPPRFGLEYSAASGYFRYHCGRLFLLGDVGELGPSYQPGHAHCDMLSFELCWDGRPIIVDTGTSTYQVGPRRAVERGTSAHNTVRWGELDQSEMWAGFRVARRAWVEGVEAGPTTITARIRAFPPRWVRLERRWTCREESVEIVDQVLDHGRDREECTARLHFHPSVALSGSGDMWRADDLRLRFEGATGVHDEEYHYAPEFNRLIPGRCLVVRFTGRLSTVLDS